MSTYRVDPHQPQNVYRGEQYIGVMVTAEDAALVVEALNGDEPDSVATYGPDKPEPPRCGSRGWANSEGCIRRAGHGGRHGYSDGSGEQDEL